MEITSYQIHNVLKTYSRQLSRSKGFDRRNASGSTAPADKINISSEGRRQAIIDKVSADIVNRITSFGPQNEEEHGIVNQLKQEFVTEGVTEFAYNQIDENNNKISSKLPLKDSNFILKRLEQLTKNTVDKNMEKKI